MLRFILLCFILLALPACSKFDVPDDDKPSTEKPSEPSGGDDDELMCITVEEALVSTSDEWLCVAGYIVGYCGGTTLSSAVFGVPKDGPNTNMLLADSPNEKRTDHVLPVSLPTGSNGFREEMNLYDHPEYLGALVGVGGFLTTYFLTTGIKSPDLIEFLSAETPSGGNDDPSGGNDDPSGGDDDPSGDGESGDVSITVDDGGSVVVGR